MKTSKQVAIAVSCGAVLFCLLVSWMVFWFGSFGAVIAYTNGEYFYIHPKHLNLGTVEAGSETEAVFTLKNLTSKEISIVGEKSSCTCAFSEKIPISAAGGESVPVKVKIQIPKTKPTYDQSIIFMVAEPGRLAMSPVSISATVTNVQPAIVAEE